MDNLDEEDPESIWMNAQTPANLLAAATIIRTPASRSSSDHQLVVRQKPQVGKVFVGKEKDRKPIDPPPIIQLRINESIDPNQNYLQSPYFFISCSLLDDDENRTEAEREEVKSALAGTLVSSLHRLKDTDNNDGGFFVFGDLSVKMEGTFRLQFTLYEVHDKEVEFIKSIQSDSFNVYASKNWPGMAESTFLTRSFSDQGVRLRLRKEPRFRLGTRGPASDDYQPRHYNRGPGQNRRSSQADFPQSSPLALQVQQGYIPAPRNVPPEYPATHTNQPIHTNNESMHDNPRKRDHSHSQSSHSGSYGTHDGYGMDEPAFKRARSEISTHSDQPLHGLPYSLQSTLPYGGRPYPETQSVVSYPPFPQNAPQPQQTYGSYGSSSLAGPAQPPQNYASYGQIPQPALPQISGSYPPRRLDTSFSNPGPSAAYESPTAVRSAMSSTSQTQSFRRSPASATGSATSYTFPTPLQQQPSYMQQPQQMVHGHSSQQQYAPQLQQPTPQSRAAINSLSGMDMYQNDGISQPRTGPMGVHDMPPPMIGVGGGRVTSLGPTISMEAMTGSGPAPSPMGMGIAHIGGYTGGSQLPSPGGNGGMRAWGGGVDQYGRPRDDLGR